MLCLEKRAAVLSTSIFPMTYYEHVMLLYVSVVDLKYVLNLLIMKKNISAVGVEQRLLD
jgi:hypothetical protein